MDPWPALVLKNIVHQSFQKFNITARPNHLYSCATGNNKTDYITLFITVVETSGS
jgi:hypothetical protein